VTTIIQQHVQTFDEIRRLGLICHGLDLSSEEIFSDKKKTQPSVATRRVLETSLSSGLLNLAIAIRVNIYQSSLNGLEKQDFPWWASLYFSDEMKIRPINLKTICDKIIHANQVGKDILPSSLTKESKTCMHFVGTHKGREWIMDFPIHEFVEHILGILDEVENATA